MGKSAKGERPAQTENDPIIILRERFVFNRETGAFFTTSREGAFILRAARCGKTRREIEKQVVCEFGVTPAVAASDTERFMLRLEEMQLLPGDVTAKT
ncbi:MAG: PqqD family protein [Paracoccaceae bacterium]